MLHYQEEPATEACQLYSLFNTVFATVKNENMETKAEFPQKWNENLSYTAGNDAREFPQALWKSVKVSGFGKNTNEPWKFL